MGLLNLTCQKLNFFSFPYSPSNTGTNFPKMIKMLLSFNAVSHNPEIHAKKGRNLGLQYAS